MISSVCESVFAAWTVAIMEQVDQALQISMGLRSPFAREEEGLNGRTVETIGKRA